MMINNDQLICRVCNNQTREVIDLGVSPAANNFVTSVEDHFKTYPLVVDFCDTCSCLQLRECLNEDELYKNYSYMTPDTVSQIDHYMGLISFLRDNSILNVNTNCLELGSNTGLFLKTLKPFVRNVLGIDPAENIASLANSDGIETIPKFFHLESARAIEQAYGQQDLIIARHMFAHNRDPKILLEGMVKLLSDKGSIVIENAYAIPTLEQGELDQIYHEHMFYFSVKSMQKLLDIFSLELTTLYQTSLHGGSIAFIASRQGLRQTDKIIEEYIDKESCLFDNDMIFTEFNSKAQKLKERLLSVINEDLHLGKSIGAYGATAKSFTLFSYLGLDSNVIKYCVDTTPTKIGMIFPYFNIPVISEDQYKSNSVDTFLVTAWNYKEHILKKSETFMKKGTKLIFPLPNFEIIEI